MRIPLLAGLALAFTLGAAVSRAENNPEIVPLGHDTYALTRWAGNGFTWSTDKLKDQALEDAAAYCAREHRELKVLSTSTRRMVPLMGFSSVKVVFKALEPNDPELHAPVDTAAIPGAAPAAEPAPARTATDALYSDIMKLDDLRKRGLLTDEEFQVLKKHLLEKSS